MAGFCNNESQSTLSIFFSNKCIAAGFSDKHTNQLFHY